MSKIIRFCESEESLEKRQKTRIKFEKFVEDNIAEYKKKYPELDQMELIGKMNKDFFKK